MTLRQARPMIQLDEPSARAIEWGLARRTAPGELVSGDECLLASTRNGVLVAVVDGLGHGEEATVAARMAIETLLRHINDPLMAQVAYCHEALRQTRGVVLTLGVIQTAERLLTWTGIGNVEGLLLRADPKAMPLRESVLLRGGVVGYQMPAFSAHLVSLKPGDLLLLATDGLRSGFADRVLQKDPPQQLADRILHQHFKGTDDALVLALRFLGSRRE